MDALRVHVVHNVPGVFWNLVGVIGFVRVPMAQRVDGMAAKTGLDVRDNVSTEGLQVAAGAVQKQQVFTGSGDKRARGDASGIYVLYTKLDSA